MTTHRVTAPGLNLRTGPGGQFGAMRVLAHGTQLVAAGAADGWLRVWAPVLEAPAEGWVSAAHVESVAPEPNAGGSADLRVAALAVATRYIGGREVDNNWGPLVELYLRNAGITSRAPWCAAFVQWCSDMARDALVGAGIAVTNPLDDVPLKALVRSYVHTARTRGWLVPRPAPGDLFAWVNPDGTGHIGFVARVLGTGEIVTVEGNTNEAGSREGDGVYRRTRRPTASYQFIRY